MIRVAKRILNPFCSLTHDLLRRSWSNSKSAPQTKKIKQSIWTALSFWLRGWDLNLTASGLWARRATKLLYPAIYGAGNGNWTRTMLSHHGILSPGRLPIPPLRRIFRFSLTSAHSLAFSRSDRPVLIGLHWLLYHADLRLSTFLCIFFDSFFIFPMRKAAFDD